MIQHVPGDFCEYVDSEVALHRRTDVKDSWSTTACPEFGLLLCRYVGLNTGQSVHHVHV